MAWNDNPQTVAIAGHTNGSRRIWTANPFRQLSVRECLAVANPTQCPPHSLLKGCANQLHGQLESMLFSGQIVRKTPQRLFSSRRGLILDFITRRQIKSIE